MSYYGTLWPEFWTGSTGRRIRREGGKAAQVLAAYLVSNRHANMLGLYHLAVDDIAHETGLKPKEIAAALTVLAVDFARYDEASEFVWVVTMVRYRLNLKPDQELAANDKKVIAINKLYHAIDVNPFLGPFFDLYEHTLRITKRRAPQGEAGEATTGSPSKGHTKGHRSPLQASNQYQDQETGTREQESGNSDQVQEKARLTPPATDNVRVITTLVRDLAQHNPELGFVDLKDLAKAACSKHRIAYDSEAIGKAVESALARGVRH